MNQVAICSAFILWMERKTQLRASIVWLLYYVKIRAELRCNTHFSLLDFWNSYLMMNRILFLTYIFLFKFFGITQIIVVSAPS